MKKHMDNGTFVIALVTLGLFVAALFSKGVSHDLFLETGVFLVSLKIIIMAYKNSVAVSQMDGKLDFILTVITKSGGGNGNTTEGLKDQSDTREQLAAGQTTPDDSHPSARRRGA